MSEPQATNLLKEHGERLETCLRGLIDRCAGEGAPPRLLEAIQYSLLAGGKRLRPALVFESARAIKGSGLTLEASASALAAAGAIELIHTFSLVHDDLPAMDDDDLRRGRPTNHKVFGEAMAILAGDAMVTMAFELLAREGDSRHVRPLVEELARASGPAGMIGGQVLDIAAENRELELEELRRLHAMKTGALLRAACRMGAIAADAGDPALAAVTEYGTQVGIAFQIADDLLDVTATAEQVGKATGKDAGRGKNTYPGRIGIDASRVAAQEHLGRALAALEPLGQPAEGLRALARFVVERRS